LFLILSSSPIIKFLASDSIEGMLSHCEIGKGGKFKD
jgi:hypothetical protein